MNETQTVAVQALRELLDNPEREDWDELVAANRALIRAIASCKPLTRRNARIVAEFLAKPDGVKARLVAPRRKQVTMRIFARLDRGTAQSARSRLKDVIMVDRTAAATGTAAAVPRSLR